MQARAKYVVADPVACYLEVLAPFRPDPQLQTDMDVIDTDDKDDESEPPLESWRVSSCGRVACARATRRARTTSLTV
jgi:hypothetical protein